MNAFATLGLPETLVLTTGEIDAAWREAGARTHPDAGGGEMAFAELRAARDTLASPAERLAHWLGLQGRTVDPRGVIAPDIMDLFGPVAEATRKAEDVARRRAAATTALGLAVLEGETLRARESVETQIATLDSAIAARCAGFLEMERAPQSVDEVMASAVVRGLRFLEKWRRNLMAAYSALA